MSDDNKPVITGRCVAREYADSFKALIDKATDYGKRHVRVAIFTHTFPDPDALGSQMGVSWILSKLFHIDADCFYSGEISHPQNNALCNLLDPQLRRVDEEYDPSQYQLRILVDTIPINAGVGRHQVDFDLVIDHHKELPNGGYNGLTFHMKVGSCCAIVFKLMEQLCKEVWFEDDNDGDSKVATAMVTGIITDTEFNTSDDSTEIDRDAYNQLFEYRDPSAFRQIVFFKRPRFWIDVKATAAAEAEIDDEGYAIVGLGLISEKQRDLIADVAEDMVSWASVETAIAFGIVNGDRIEGSVRSLNASTSVSDLCKKLGGKFGQGGGKLGKGAYRYTLAGMSIDPDEDEDIKQKTWECFKEKEKKRISRLIKK